VIQLLRHLGIVALIAVFGGIASAQEKADAPKPSPVPLKLQVVISRFDADKKISSMPYMMSVNAGRQATLRIGTSVPIASTTFTPAAAGAPSTSPLTSYNYRDVGTNIDARTTSADDGRYAVELSVEDSSVEDRPIANAAQMPALRSFRFSNSFMLKDGQTAQFITAVDKVTGVVTKVDVTLTVVK
jgi:type II secretory pathway component GspD/PulD (secretin)